MSKIRARAIPVFIVFLFLLMVIQLPSGEGVMTGPVVDVNISGQTIEAGDSTTVTVLVEDFDGESSTPMDLIEVRLSVTAGTFEPETAITGIDGYCQFTYHAPDEIEGPTDVTVTATGEFGALDKSGSDDVTVSYRLVGQIIGPAQVLAGGGAVGYVVLVTANDEPVINANVMPTVFGAGSKGIHTSRTNATGEATLVIHPGDSPGQISILVQLGAQDYMSSAVSRIVNVVDELATLRMEDINLQGIIPNWGSKELSVRLFRGEDPVPGQQVQFITSEGYFLMELVTTDNRGYANATYIASYETDEHLGREVMLNVSANDGAETTSLDKVLTISDTCRVEMRVDPLMDDGDTQALLFPGEQIIHEPKLLRWSGPLSSPAYDMSLVFELMDPSGIIVHSDILATGIDSFEKEVNGQDFAHYQSPVSVYQVPQDPVEGNYSFVYKLTSQNGAHTYSEMSKVRIDGYKWVEDYQISIYKNGKEDWTFMYYMAGDNDLSPYMDLELERLKNEAPNGEFKVYIFFDRTDDQTFYQYEGGRWWGARKWDLEAGEENGIEIGRAVNSGDMHVLYDFMTWVSHCSPSGHYSLVISDHGKGFKGICYDSHEPVYNEFHDIIGMDFLDPDEVGQTLRSFKRDRRKVDVVTLAACGMSGIEFANKLSPYSEYIVASQLPTYSEHGLTTEKVLQHLKGYDWESYSPTPFQVSVDFVNGFIEESGGTDYDSAISVISSPDIIELSTKFNETMRTIYNNWELLGESFSTAYEATIKTPGPELGEYENGDLKGFLMNLREELLDLILDPTGRSVFNDVQDCLEIFDETISYHHLIDELNGLNIYMPDISIPSNPYRFGEGLYFHHVRYIIPHYALCLRMYAGDDFDPFYGDEQDENGFTPLDPVQGHIIDEDDDGLGNTVIINLTPSQGDQELPFRVVIDCLQFSGKGGGYLSDMLKKRIVLDQDDIDGMTQLEIGVPAPGWYDIVVRVLDENNNIIQKFIVGNYTMEETEPEGSPPELNITASEMTLTVGDELDLTSSILDPDGDDIDLIWDFDHRDGIFFDSDEEDPSTRYIKPGNVTVTCIVTDGEYTVVKSLDLVIEAAVGNNAPTSGMTSKVYEWGEVTLDALDLSSDPDDDELYYKFNFGDGNWSEWIGESSASHHYSETGIYNCSVRVMDIRGSVSERSFLLVTIETVSNKTGEKDDDDNDPVGPLAILGMLALLVVIAILPLAILALILVLKRKKVSKEEEEGEEEETW